MNIASALVIAESQASVLSLAQCHEAGLSRTSVRTLVATQRWQRVHRRVFATHTGSLDDEARIWAAVLAVGGAVAVSNETALWLNRTRRGALGPVIHLTVESERRVVAPDGVVVHRLTRPFPAYGWPRRMESYSALLEAARQAPTVEALVHLVCNAVGDELVQPRRLARELRERPRHRWKTLLGDMLTDVAAGAQSPLELADLSNDLAHGLPSGERQVKTRAGGMGRWLDVVVRTPGSGFVLVKELDGRLGHEGTGRFRYMDRDNMAAARGATAVRFGWTAIVQQGCQSAAFQRLVWLRNDVTVGRGCADSDCRPDERLKQLEAAHPRWDQA